MNIIHEIYCLPLYTAVIFMFLSVILWTAASNIPYRKIWRIFNTACFIVSAASILYITVLNRTPNSTNQVILIPFHSFAEAKHQREIYRSMLMNCMLFLPFGLSLPFALSEKTTHKISVTVLSAAVFSLLIELMQYAFSLGRAEVDDIICNSLGAALGCLSYCIFRLIQKRPRPKSGD